MNRFIYIGTVLLVMGGFKLMSMGSKGHQDTTLYNTGIAFIFSGILIGLILVILTVSSPRKR